MISIMIKKTFLDNGEKRYVLQWERAIEGGGSVGGYIQFYHLWDLEEYIDTEIEKELHEL